MDYFAARGPNSLNRSTPPRCAVLNVAANVSKYYSHKGEEGDIEIVAFNAGLHMLREDSSPVKARLKSFKQGTQHLVHRLREHAGGDDPQRRQGTTAGGEMPRACRPAW